MLGKFENLISGIESEMQELRKENERLKLELQTLKNANPSAAKTAERAKNIIKDLFNRLSEMAIMVDKEGTVIFANKQFCTFYCVDNETVSGKKIYDLPFVQFAKDLFNQRMDDLAKNDGKIAYQATHQINPGVDSVFNVSAFDMEMDGQIYTWFFIQDITEHVNVRNELRELNYLLNSILDNLPVYLFVKDVDDDLRYLYWNKAFATYSKIPASRVIGNTDYEVFPDYNDAQKFRDDDMEVVTSQETIYRHETYEAADGKTRIVQTVKTLIPREGRGPLLVGISMDITNMQNIEQELVQERLRAEESDRLKSRFLANMSHEIRTPLNAIVGFANLLVENEEPELHQQFSEIIVQNSEVLLQLINDILDLSKIEAGTLEYVRSPMDLVDTCNNIYEVHKNKVHEGVTLYFDNSYMKEEFVINEDRNRITQVINNLISNASKFTTEGEIRFGFTVKGEWIEVYVKDTGLGIAPDKQAKVFDRFVKLNQFVQGTGLGLPICKLIVETMGGKMTLESEPNKGSTFRFTIPYKADQQRNLKPESLPTAPQSKQSTAADKSRKTILIAEDVYSNYLLVKTLVANRFNLLWAKDGNEAVKLFKENNPDLILMDIKMPNVDGLAATKLIRTYSGEVPIVALTAHAFETDKKKAYEAGVNGYMTKPVDKASFEKVLTEFL